MVGSVSYSFTLDVQHYVIKFVDYLWQVGGFLRVLRFTPSIKLRSGSGGGGGALKLEKK